jgi:hypothetical protein
MMMLLKCHDLQKLLLLMSKQLAHCGTSLAITQDNNLACV